MRVSRGLLSCTSFLAAILLLSGLMLALDQPAIGRALAASPMSAPGVPFARDETLVAARDAAAVDPPAPPAGQKVGSRQAQAAGSARAAAGRAVSQAVTVTFDFDDGPQGWEGLPGAAGCPPAVWNEGDDGWDADGHWRTAACADNYKRGKVALEVPYDAETLTFYFSRHGCIIGHGADLSVYVDDTRIYHEPWAGNGTRTVDMSGYAAPYRLTIGLWAGTGCARAALDDVRLSGSATLPEDQANALCDCPVGCSEPNQNWVGGPINTRTGNYHTSQQDLSVAALGGPLRFERSYNSLETARDLAPLGPGWTHNYAMDLTFPDDPGGETGTIVVRGCHGSRFRFHGKGDGTYSPYPGVWATLTRTLAASPTYHLRGADQSTYVFSGTGCLVEMRSAEGQSIHLRYDDGRLARVEDATGDRFLALSYDSQGRLLAVRDPLSRTVTYTYDTLGNLALVTDTRGYGWRYTYTATHLLRDVVDPLDQLVERTDYALVEGGWRAVRQWEGGSTRPLRIDYCTDGHTVITDPLGHVSVDAYHGYGLLVSQQEGASSRRRTYDAHFNWTSMTDAEGHTTHTRFNALGLPEVITDALGHASHVEYDALDRPVALTNALSHAAYYTYTGGLLVEVADAMEDRVLKQYDERGLLVERIDHGVTTTFRYDTWGQMTAMTQALGMGTGEGLVTRYGYRCCCLSSDWSGKRAT